MVLHEVIRLAPPVGDDFRLCNHDDVLPSGVKIRKKTRMIIPNLAIGRDEFLWKNAESFNPERWMAYENGVAKPVRRVDEYVHPIFFAGKRLCLGKDMARFESIVFMAKIFTKLHVKPLPDQSDEMSSGPVIFRKDGIKCQIEKRIH